MKIMEFFHFLSEKFKHFYQRVAEAAKTVSLRWWLFRHRKELSSLEDRADAETFALELPSDEEILHAKDTALLEDEPDWVRSKVQELSWYEQDGTARLVAQLKEQLKTESEHPWGRLNIFNIYCCLLRRGKKEQLLAQLEGLQAQKLAQVLCSVVHCVELPKAA